MTHCHLLICGYNMQLWTKAHKTMTRKKRADHVEKFPAEVASQQAAKWLSVPAQLHPTEMLLQSQLSTLKPWLGQCANQKTALLEVVQSLHIYWPKGVELRSVLHIKGYTQHILLLSQIIKIYFTFFRACIPNILWNNIPEDDEIDGSAQSACFRLHCFRRAAWYARAKSFMNLSIIYRTL